MFAKIRQEPPRDRHKPLLRCSAFVLTVRVSSIRLHTLNDFVRHGITVQVFCTACGHRQDLHPEHLQATCVNRSLPIHLRRLERHFRCSRCRAKCAQLYPGKALRSR